MSDHSSVDDRVWFVYTSGITKVPQHVSHVRIDPTTVHQIPDGAFAFCQRLIEVEVLNNDAALQVCKVIGRRAFHQCLQLEDMYLPSSTQEIGDRAFEECKMLQICDLPKGLKWIGKRAFRRCESLVEVIIPPLMTDISSFSFQSCIRLLYLNLPTGLKVIRNYAFHGCILLEELKLPNTVEEIGESAFELCKSISRIKIPMSTKRIGDSAFSQCRSLKTVDMPPKSNYHNINTGLCLSMRKTFAGCTDLRNIFLPPSLDVARHSKQKVAYFDTEGDESEWITTTQKLASTTRFKDCYLLDKALTSFRSLDDARRVDGMLELRFGKEPQDGKYDNYKLHRFCYYQSHYSTTESIQWIEEMVHAARQRCAGNHYRDRYHTASNTEMMSYLLRRDSLGMTPIHILVMSSAPRIELLQTIVNLVPQSASILIDQKDIWGMTPLDCVKFPNELFEFTLGVLRLAIGRRVDFLVPEMQREVLSSLLHRLDPERPVQRRRQIIGLLQKLAQFERGEAVCIVEQALWKQKCRETDVLLQDDDEEEDYVNTASDRTRSDPSGEILSLRELCRLNCGADIVIVNVLTFLGKV
ncbi:unnamed protein product [Cylindrotheca closterium]|uniref:Uncharacterized protein n=1 Tax=Cylindrotheca closterium TaxID=2856 RepID=A0AAD2CGR7_9STRA|nr:unnamed protein product [Cylindrotheca closterium]